MIINFFSVRGVKWAVEIRFRSTTCHDRYRRTKPRLNWKTWRLTWFWEGFLRSNRSQNDRNLQRWYEVHRHPAHHSPNTGSKFPVTLDPSKHERLTRCCSNAGPASATLPSIRTTSGQLLVMCLNFEWTRVRSTTWWSHTGKDNTWRDYANECCSWRQQGVVISEHSVRVACFVGYIYLSGTTSTSPSYVCVDCKR